MLSDCIDAQAIREILDLMKPYVLEEGRMYRTLSDIRVRAHRDDDKVGNEYLILEEGTVVIPCRERDGTEAVLIEGVVVPFIWSRNATELMFEPVEE